MAITKIWAANGIKSPIPATPQGDNLVNYDEGFTTPYRTPIKDGGVPIGMGTFNQLMFDITDEIIQNKSTLNQVAQQINSIIDDTQTNLTSTWSSQLIDTKLSTAVAGVIDDNQTTSTLTWSSVKISAEIGQGGGGSAVIDDNTITTDKVWSSFKTNQMVKGGRTISVSNWETKEGSGDTTITNTTANAKMVNLSVKVKTNATADKYLGDIVVYYNDPSNEILRQSCVSQNIANATDLTSAMGMTILDAQDSLIIKSAPASGVQDFWNNVKLMENTSNVTGSAPEPEPLGEGLIFTAQASSSSVTLNKQGTPTELQLEYQTTKADVTSGWQPYTLGTAINLDANDKVAFRNTGTQTITQTADNYHFFTMAGEIKPENSISFLFDSTGTHDSIGEYECYKMFVNCSALAEMPDLPATNIAANGYANMFEGCTKLKTIKPLNATTITNYSYKEMFKNCSGLIISEGSGENQFLSMPTSAPSNAGDNMFIGTGGRFVGSPTAGSNYFYNATLPATTMLRFTAQAANTKFALVQKGTGTTLNLEININSTGWVSYDIGTPITLTNKNDYVEMRNKGLQHPTNYNTSNYNVFEKYNWVNESGNANLIVSGNLMYLFDKTGEKKDMPPYGFCNLFYGSSTTLTFQDIQLPATTLAEGCYYTMFKQGYNSSRKGVLPKLPALRMATLCYSNMFADWTGENPEPDMIAATTLANSCFSGMFTAAYGITKAPRLPQVSTAPAGAFAGMFHSTNLKVTQGSGENLIFTAPSNAGTSDSRQDPCYYMFYNTRGAVNGERLTAGQKYYWNT